MGAFIKLIKLLNRAAKQSAKKAAAKERCQERVQQALHRESTRCAKAAVAEKVRAEKERAKQVAKSRRAFLAAKVVEVELPVINVRLNLDWENAATI